MERLLARSKSLKIRRDVEEHHQGLPSIMDQVPENGASPHGAILQSPSLTSLQIATNSFDPNLPRPKTANAAAPARRNWSELTATGSPIEITADEDTFLFPTPVSRKVPSPILSSAVKPAEMESTDDVVNIGVAIGSPSQTSYFSPPMSSSRLAPPSQQDVTTPRTPPMRSNTTRETRTEDMDGARPKLSRWKSLGGLFGRKRFASPPISRQGSRDALELKKREVAELRGEIAVQTTINSTVTSPYSPRHLRKSKKSVKGRSPLLRSNLWDSDVPSGASPPPSQFAPLLNVDIPQVRMERYSVMFSELLPQRPTRSSSLLARRQAMGDRLKPPGGPLKTLDIPVVTGKLVRRATDPSPSASPAYRLFPSEQTDSQSKTELTRTFSTIHRPRPLRRSNTAPSSLPLPDPIVAALSPAFEVDELDSDENGRTPTPSSHGSPTTPKHNDVFAYPNTRLSDTSQSTDRSTEPSWEMITIGKPLEPGDLLDDELLHEDDIDDEDWLAKTKPQVSIARSMSVTRANKEKLVVKPVGRGSNSIRGREKRREGASRATIEGRRNEIKRELLGDRSLTGKNEKLVEKKSLTPTLHHVEDNGNRNSVWGLIESV